MVTAVLASCQQPKMGPQPDLSPLVPRPSEEASLVARSTSTESSGAGVDKVRLRVGFGGSFALDTRGEVKYVGGNWHLDSIPVTFKYADLAFRLTEKVNDAVSIKYLPPGDSLDADNLIGVWDDADVQEMYEEYIYSVQHSDAQARAPRLLVFLFAANEEDGSLLTPEQDLDGCNFFEANGYCKGGDQMGHAVGMNSSLDSSYSGGGAGDIPEHACWNGASRLSRQAGRAEMTLALSGIENNPFVAPWHMPGSEETCSGLSTAMQKCMGVSGASPKHGDMCESQRLSAAGQNKENSMAMQLPTHLSVFGDIATRLPSHISVFGDSCNLQLQPALVATAWPDGILSPHGASRLHRGSAAGEEGGCLPAGWGEHKSASPKVMQGGSAAWDLPRSSSWTHVLASVPHVPKDAVRITGTIAEGAFGQVSIAKTQQFCEVAIKWIKPGRVDQHLGAFWREASLLSRLNHPNVLRMYGVVVESDADPTIVGIMTEYVRGGSLSANLRNCTAVLPLLLRAQLAVQIASGMAFLHESNVVHFDLKPDNLLLDVPLSGHAFSGHQAPCIKVADFGLSKEKRQSYVSGVRDLRGTLPFIAPELVNDPDRITEKADVWSMGMLMWELLTLASPFQDLAPNMIIGGLMKGTLRPEVPEWCEPSWAHLMRSCWALDPEQRPSFRCMALELEHLIELLTPGGGGL